MDSERDDNSQQQFEQDQQEQWYAYTRRLLNEHEIIGRVIQHERVKLKELIEEN